MRNLYTVEAQRVPLMGRMGNEDVGCFTMTYKGAFLRIIACAAEGWDHVSVSLEDRTPTWDEMDHVKRMFFKDRETAYQLHVPVSEHINCHPNCLHIWRKHNFKMPLPPRIMV